MSRQTIINVIDDLTGKPGATTVNFGVDGVAYEIDLTDESRAKLDKLIGPYLGAAVRIPAQKAGRVSRDQWLSDAPRASSPAERQQRKAIRAWWRENWEAAELPEPSDFGRIPDAVQVAFKEHDGAAVAAAKKSTAGRGRRAAAS